jgi:hydroxypyruvate isomerase
MNRRVFNQKLSSLALGASVLGRAPVLISDQDSKAAVVPSIVPFQLSVMLWTVFNGMPMEDRLAKVAEAGYSNVGLVGEYRTWTDDQYASIHAKRISLGITFDATGVVKTGVSNPQDRDAMLTELKNMLPILEKLESPTVIMFSGNVVPELTRDQQHQSCIDGLKAAVQLIEGKKINGQLVKIIIENNDPEENPKYFLNSMAEEFEIVKAVDHPQVRAVYDIYHEQVSQGNLIKKLQNNLPYIAVIHIADVPGRHEPGTGEINCANIYRKLVELKYDGTVAMEFKPTGDGVAMLRVARTMAESAVASGH